MLVLVEDSAEPVASADMEGCVGVRMGDGRGYSLEWPGVGDALVRAVAVVELLELAQHVDQVPLVPDQRPVEQLSPAGQHPAFYERVHPGHLVPAEHDPDTRVLEHRVEQGRVLAVAIPDQEFRPAARVLQVHDEVPGGLGHPVGIGVRGCAEDPDAAGGVLDDRQDEQARTG